MTQDEHIAALEARLAAAEARIAALELRLNGYPAQPLPSIYPEQPLNPPWWPQTTCQSDVPVNLPTVFCKL